MTSPHLITFPSAHRFPLLVPALFLVGLFGALLGACPGPKHQGTTARPAGPRYLKLAFSKGHQDTYNGKLLFQARMDQLGTKQTNKHLFLASFVLTRQVTSADKERTCFEDRFSEATVRIDNLPPRLTGAVAKELNGAKILWCLDKTGRLSMFSAMNLGPALRGLKLSSVLSRIYQMAAGGSVQGKKLGDEWKQTTTTRQTIAHKPVETSIQASFSVMESDTCRPSPLNSDDEKKLAASEKTSSSSAPADCLEVMATEQGVIPDFEMSKDNRSFKMGGVIKGKASIVIDPKTSSWRAWAFRRVVGIAATTKIKGASADFGMRTDVLFQLDRVAK